MEPGEILVGLKLIINTTEFDEVIFSLHQDPKIWEKVSEDNFLEDFSKLHGNEPDMWNPGLIGLFSIYNDSLHEIISANPLQPIPSELRQQASAFYQKALKSGFIPSTLAESTYLALALRERKRLTGNWTGLLSEIVRSSSDHTVAPGNLANFLCHISVMVFGRSGTHQRAYSVPGTFDRDWVL